jgi:hypothetical protein
MSFLTIRDVPQHNPTLPLRSHNGSEVDGFEEVIPIVLSVSAMLNCPAVVVVSR